MSETKGYEFDWKKFLEVIGFPEIMEVEDPETCVSDVLELDEYIRNEELYDESAIMKSFMCLKHSVREAIIDIAKNKDEMVDRYTCISDAVDIAKHIDDVPLINAFAKFDHITRMAMAEDVHWHPRKSLAEKRWIF